jgi:CHAT domain-containing protein
MRSGEVAGIEDRMTPPPVFRRSASLFSHGALWLLIGLLTAVLCCAEGPAPSAAAAHPVAREIHGGETHVYPFELQAGQFLRVVVEENGVKLSLRLVDPAGTLVTGADSPGPDDYADEAQELAVVAASPGSYRLEVNASGEGAGRYFLRVEGPRKPTAADQGRATAVQAAWEALASKDQIGSFERALTHWRQVGDREKTAEILYRLGRLRYKPATGQALADFRQAAVDWGGQTSHRSRVFQAEALTWVGRCLKNLDRPEEARAAHDQALALARELGEAGLQAENLNLLGRLVEEEGEIQKGLDLRHQALEKALQAGNPRLESQILNNLGLGYQSLGEMQRALKLFEQALSLARRTSNRPDEIKYLINLGGTYRVLGNWEEAFTHYETALELTGSADDGETAKILINLADVYRHRRELAKARDSLNRALVLGREIGERKIQVFALAQLALLLRLDQPLQAADLAREAVSLGRSSEDEAFSRYALGSVLRDLGDQAAARAELTKALDLARRRGDREAEINFALAHLCRQTGDLETALSSIRSVSDLIESWRGGVVDPEVKTSFLASTQEIYELQVNTLMALHAQRPMEGFAAEALRASEQARARSLLEILNEAQAQIDLGAEPAVLERERQTRQDLSARDYHLRELLKQENPDSEKLAEARRRLEEALDAYRRAQVELRQSSPRYAALTQPQPLSLGEIQRQALDGGALLLEYSLGAEKSFLWAVTSDSFASFTLPERDRIEETARRYYERLTARNDNPEGESLPAKKARIKAADDEAQRVGRELSKLILQPVEPLLGRRPLLIVADGALQYVPFAALPLSSTGAPLVSGHEVVSLPSASVLAVLRRELRGRQPAPRALAIFADPVFEPDDERIAHGAGKAGPLEPPSLAKEETRGGQAAEPTSESELRRLRASGTEADAIAALLPPQEVFKAVGCAASRSAVTEGGLDLFRTVHFATHGFIESDRPELSRLVMSLYDENGQRRDGYLRLSDIYGLRLDADLVVLSACRTALGKEIRGEGLVGLTRGFMYAGAARVLASLWSVEDRATAELMAIFYRGMLRDGLSPAAALRQAQLEVARKPSWRAPFYWAGFSLQGEWR